MAGPTTAERGARGTPRRPRQESGPPPAPPAGGRFRFRPGRRGLLIALAAAALAAGAGWLLYGSSWLRVESVRASGTDVLTTAQVVRAAEVPVGEPLVSLDTDAVEERILRRLPRADTVEVSRSWPRGVTLEVTERQPVLQLVQGRRYVEVDDDGVRFATVDRPVRGVPRLELAVERSPSLRRFPLARLTREAVRVREGLPGKVVADLRTLVVRSYDDMVLELTGERRVVWGSPEEGEAKARALTALLKAAPRARHFDVSAPTAPAVSAS
ncbi:cell division protein FtsQ/DivIB [Streptomyces yaizuensis]|uniref:Cell division protein FtsQ n=1 Tax=Streptomyces yaizuensis TaxID=2989713 RepID=A0ABQ5NUZ5_9ACTN|nr:FtsQ-type POTRA domain-containing protein [Streptomyces sp. YSPA8]GLF94188.1 FtsQ-type POTRA domain-containing protein [Streptomyces sp. YSPA8]